MWKVFNNGDQTSPTSTLRKHFKHEHSLIWESECCNLKIPRGSGSTEQSFSSSVEEFTREGLMVRLRKFIVGDDQVCFFRFFHSADQFHAVNQRD